MKNIKIINLNFDMRTKIIMLICIVIAICIIAYSFYTICIKLGRVEDIGEKNIEYYLSAKEYQITFDVTVNSNKNSNTYSVVEKANLLEEIYEYTINDKFQICINPSEIKIFKTNIDYEYITSNQNEYIHNNFISFSSIIKMVNKINEKALNGNIKRVEINENIIYKIEVEEEYIKKIKRIEIIMSKNDEEIQEIKMYDLDNKEMYFITIYNFVVKK
ncbi:MAG: hypothetical protein J6A15_07060 [Clostridia bacterium]|nr:hypothetical protein [Clostridia bacterium]